MVRIVRMFVWLVSFLGSASRMSHWTPLSTGCVVGSSRGIDYLKMGARPVPRADLRIRLGDAAVRRK
jgi:hypothetical protein